MLNPIFPFGRILLMEFTRILRQELFFFVAERVESRVEDRWTNSKVNEQVDMELKRLEEDIQRAHVTYNGQVRSSELNAESRASMSRDTSRTETGGRSETFIPETERERHETRY
jgi:hypothetical protein